MGEIAGFLARYAPFRNLEPDQLQELETTVKVETFAPGDVILAQSAAPASFLHVIREGVVDLEDEGAMVDHMGEGEVFGISVLSGVGPALTVRARTPTSCYLIESGHAREILGSSAGLAFLTALAARWRERVAVEEHLRGVDVEETLASDIRKADTLAELVAASDQLASMIAVLLDRHVDPIDIGHVVGGTIDELTRRLIELHIASEGDPPTAFAWLALGSAARHEQSLNTDQDHALALDAVDGSEAEVDPWFAGLAEFVISGIEACGIARCDGGVMTNNPAWRRTLGGWRRRFGEYVSDEAIMGTRISGIVFDYRRVTGTLDVEPVLDDAIREARSDPAFMDRLVTTVLQLHPSTSRRKGMTVEKSGEHRGTFDVKHGGITPITNLARFYAIDSGLTENRTIERLRGAASGGRISAQRREDLEEAFRLLWRVRLEHHVMQREAGSAPDDWVDPDSLRPIARRAAEEALRIVDAAQASLAKERSRSARG